ncbi:beta-eliminating lyase-related protein [Vibrio coralliilyticus]|uniref:beta-eliminating lyase-related protein n=1 Tax=Vibrio coralliilyticus TaxID=190893 RepID=UPI002FD5891C
MDELQQHASIVLADFSGAEAGAISHCTASAITVSVAALISKGESNNIAQLPDTTGLMDKVIIFKDHVVNFGHSILQSIRLSGATPIIVNNNEDYLYSLADKKVCGVLLVSSKLSGCQFLDFKTVIKLAHKQRKPVIIDAAAQDFRLKELINLDADLILVSAQKYLAAPTAGLIFGKSRYIAAVRKQESGIGRGMKPTKEAIAGVLAAIEERKQLDITNWVEEQHIKNKTLLDELKDLKGLDCRLESDPTGLPFNRVNIIVNNKLLGLSAEELSYALRNSTPSIWINDQNAKQAILQLELPLLELEEVKLLCKVMKNIIYLHHGSKW